MSENQPLTKFQDIVYRGLLRAEDPDNFDNLFVILDEVCDEIYDTHFVQVYDSSNSTKIKEDKEK